MTAEQIAAGPYIVFAETPLEQAFLEAIAAWNTRAQETPDA